MKKLFRAYFDWLLDFKAVEFDGFLRQIYWPAILGFIFLPVAFPIFAFFYWLYEDSL